MAMRTTTARTTASTGSAGTDAHGNPMTGSADTIACYDRAIDHLLRFNPEVIEAAGELTTEHADAPMGHAVLAYLFLGATEQPALEPVREAWEAMAASQMNEREQAHHQVIGSWLEGDWIATSTVLDALLERYPGDLLALQVGHNVDFFLGDNRNLMDRPGRSLAELDPEHPHTALVRGMQAFGLEEAGDLARAEEVGRQAVEVNPDDVWAIHAVTHSYEMQGRVDEGIRFLDATADGWTEGNLFTVHNWWHLGLFQLEAGNAGEALRIYDAEVHNDQMEAAALSMVDASAMLWRLYLDGVDTGDRFSAIADAWQPLADAPAWYAFNDLHAVMAQVGAGRTADAEKVIEKLSTYVHRNGGGTNVTMTAEVGLPASRAVLRFGQGRYDEVIDELVPIRRTLHTFGGSHAQRDVLQRTLLVAAQRAGRTDLARALISERLSARETSVWTWGQRAQLLDALGRSTEAAEASAQADRNQAVFATAALEAGLRSAA